MIVLNGEPFVRYNLRALYPFAHEIIVAEGAVPSAVSIAASDGHSIDATLETLRDFKANEDPDDKLILVTAEDEGHPDGFWPGEKHEQSRAYARRATGDYLWQVDVDEFYKSEDMLAVLDMLRDDESITALSFKQTTFWGGFDYIVDGWYLRKGANIYHRLFKWGPGYKYVSHRPPTVHNEQGQDLRNLHWVNGKALSRRRIFIYHYSLLLPQQVIEKCEYYNQATWVERNEARRWAEESFLRLGNPYRVHNVYDYPSWLEKFAGIHPPQIENLRTDLRDTRLDIALRPTGDIEQLLQSPAYRFGRAVLKLLASLYYLWDRPWRLWQYHLRPLAKDPSGNIRKLREKAS